MSATFVRLEHPDRPPSPPRHLSWHARANVVCLVWALLAMVTAILTGPLGTPTWLPIHLFLLGTVTNAIVTWTEHFTVALLRLPATSDRYQAGRLLALNVGIAALSVGAILDVFVVAVPAGLVVSGVVIAHTVFLARSSRRALSGRFGHLTRWYTGAGASFVVGASLGVVLLSGVDPRLQQRLLTAHVHLNLLGWVGLAVLGTLFTLWPTILRTRIVEGTATLARRTPPLLLAGLGVLATGLVLDLHRAVLAGLVLYSSGVLIVLVPLVRTSLRKRPAGAAAWSVVASVVWLLAALVVDVLVVVGNAPHQLHAELGPLVPLFLVGFVGQVLLGSLTYLLPVILGGGPKAVRANIALLGWGWRTRLVCLNLALPLTLLPKTPGVVAWAVVFFSLLAFVGLSATAVARSWEVTFSPAMLGTGVGAVLTVLALLLALSGVGGQAATTEPTGRTRTVEVVLGDMVIEPADVTVDPGDALVLEVTNEDVQPHDLRMENGVRTPVLSPGQQATLEVGVVEEALEGWCSVMGHRAAGMSMNVWTTDSGGGAPTDGGQDGGRLGSTGATDVLGPLDLSGQMSRDWEPIDPVPPPASDAEEHEVEIRVSESEQEVAPGLRRPVWTFGGTVPGPILRGEVGDVFTITLVNDGTMGHSIDFHAGALAPDDPMRTIAPGEELTYRFVAEKAGAWLYHCSTKPMSHHLANGMYGAVIIDPPDLVQVDREYVLVQGELYLGEPGGKDQVARIQEGRPNGWMFNGTAAGYEHAPLIAKVGERVRVWVVAAGPTSGTSFHIVGSFFDTVYQEGAYRLRPQDDGGAQALDLGVAQGGFVETVFPEAGHYPFVDHDLRHAEAGAYGHFEVEEG